MGSGSGSGVKPQPVGQCNDRSRVGPSPSGRTVGVLAGKFVSHVNNYLEGWLNPTFGCRKSFAESIYPSCRDQECYC
jgi:hypothetical protein